VEESFSSLRSILRGKGSRLKDRRVKKITREIRRKGVGRERGRRRSKLFFAFSVTCPLEDCAFAIVPQEKDLHKINTSKDG